MAPDTTTWTDPLACPFCGGSLPDPGEGFVRHLADQPECRDRFDVWRDNLTGDIVGEWPG